MYRETLHFFLYQNTMSSFRSSVHNDPLKNVFKWDNLYFCWLYGGVPKPSHYAPLAAVSNELNELGSG